MAMSLQIPSSPSDGSSTSSSPLTPPPIPESLSDANVDSNSATIPPAPAGKRKPSRRANTAERRATHNAVERQRRETLNGRFLDLAGLLPNLSQIRRPSKSAIVNSSIAHIHASRRHRLIAARELRTIKAESDALRRELNEWRDRSGLPRLEEPPRGDDFNLILSGEVEVIVPSTQHEDEEGMDDDCEDDLPPPVHQNGAAHAHSQPQQGPGGPQPHPAIAQLLHGRQHPHATPPHHISTGGPIIASHQSPVSYENPAMIYDGYHPSQFGFNVSQSYTNGQLPPHILAQLAAEMEHKAAPGWYNNSTGQFTPPSSSGGPSPVGSPFGGIGGGLSGGSRGSPVGSYELVSGTHMENVPRWRDEGMVRAPGPNPTAYSLLM